MADPNNAGTQTAPAAAANASATGASSNAGTQNQQGNMVPIAALHEERDKRQALQAEVEALKSTVNDLKNAGQAGNGSSNAGAGAHSNAGQFTEDTMVQQLDALWRDDPRRGMQAELMIALNWRDQIESQVDEQFEHTAVKYKDFGDYQAEVRRHLRKLPLEQRSKPGVVEAAFFMVKGRKADELIKTETEKNLQKIKDADAAQGAGGGSSGGGQGGQAITLTADQKAAAAALGMSEADYMKHMKRK